jgi:protein-S-isoprenylcysteine O-methyltransferase Ste14
MTLLPRSVLSFVALPGLVAFVVPLAVLPRAAGTFNAPALLPLGAGLLVLLWCVRDFHVRGLGTLAPWDPPTRLVVSGLYRYSRNPMYVGVLLILFGWAAAFATRGHLLYALVMCVVFHLRVVYFEEPWLAETHGSDWYAYRACVHRWLGRKSRLASDVKPAYHSNRPSPCR